METDSNYPTFDDERLAEYATEVRAAIDALLAVEPSTVTDDQLAEAESLADHLAEVQAHQGERVAAAESRVTRAEALRSRFAPAEEPPADEPAAAAVAEPEAAAADAPVASGSTVAALAAVTARPQAPTIKRPPITITAAQDVPGFATSSEIPDMAGVTEAMIARMSGFAPPNGDGQTESLQMFGVAQFKLDIPEDLMIKTRDEDAAMRILAHAADETRLPGGSLVAANGWCSPSEQKYDLCAGETTDGLVSVPEVGVNRGGFKYTKGPDFAAIYAAVGFLQTEAQAISGTTKACYEVPCPTWSDVRLDAIGLCIKAPILLNAAFPELVQRWLTGSMIAHAHKVNAQVLARMTTIAGSARVVTGLGTAIGDALEGLELIADGRRENWRLALDATLEVVVPFWVKGVFRSDLGRRTGRPPEAVSDAEIIAHFAVRHLNVQFVYDWQPLTLTPEVYPTTYDALMYPAGTFVKGTSDVITLNAVYDAASLATNMYTALFFEEGLLMANTCYDADRITLPTCTAGRTGAADLTCA